MLDIILVLTGLLGFGLAAYYDIKTTEFSEMIPYGMIVIAIFAKLASAYLTGSYDLFFTSVANGIFLLAIGLALYYLGQWGDGDAFLLGTLGFLFPIPNVFFNPEFMLPLPAALVFNTFAIGSVYTILSAAYIGLTNKKVWKIFVVDVHKNLFIIVAAAILFFAIFLELPLAIGWYLGLSVPAAAITSSLWFLLPAVLIVLFWRYARIIDEKMFTKKIAASRLKVGDVVKAFRLWKGVTRNEVKELRRKGGYVVIREGLRFAPVFLFSFVATLVIGDVVLLLLGF